MNVREYGTTIEDGEQGVIDNDYVSGVARAAYVGECRPCRATVSRVVARLSAVGTRDERDRGHDSRLDLGSQRSRLVPNTYANEALPPQARSTITGNTVTNSGRARVPIRTALAGLVGIGIAVAGGNENVIRQNRVTGSQRYGSGLPDGAVRRLRSGVPGPATLARAGNRVSRNVVTGSGWADLALAKGAGKAIASPPTSLGVRCRAAFRLPPVGAWG